MLMLGALRLTTDGVSLKLSMADNSLCALRLATDEKKQMLTWDLQCNQTIRKVTQLLLFTLRYHIMVMHFQD